MRIPGGAASEPSIVRSSAILRASPLAYGEVVDATISSGASTERIMSNIDRAMSIL